MDEMVKLYVRFHKEAENDPALEDEGRAWFKKIEDGDEEALSIFNWFKEVTLKDAQKIYEHAGRDLRFLRRRELLQRQDAARSSTS